MMSLERYLEDTRCCRNCGNSRASINGYRCVLNDNMDVFEDDVCADYD